MQKFHFKVWTHKYEYYLNTCIKVYWSIRLCRVAWEGHWCCWGLPSVLGACCCCRWLPVVVGCLSQLLVSSHWPVVVEGPSLLVAVLHWQWLPIVIGLILVGGSSPSPSTAGPIIGVSAPRSCCHCPACLPGQCSPQCFSMFLVHHPCAGGCPVSVGTPPTVTRCS
jgi:hypothetical protein